MKDAANPQPNAAAITEAKSHALAQEQAAVRHHNRNVRVLWPLLPGWAFLMILGNLGGTLRATPVSEEEANRFILIIGLVIATLFLYGVLRARHFLDRALYAASLMSLAWLAARLIHSE